MRVEFFFVEDMFHFIYEQTCALWCSLSFSCILFPEKKIPPKKYCFHHHTYFYLLHENLRRGFAHEKLFQGEE